MTMAASDASILAKAIANGEPLVHLEHATASLERLFRDAMRIDRRLLAYLGGYEADYMKKSRIAIAKDYNITITYRDELPGSIDDVLICDSGWDEEKALLAFRGDRFLVTSNEDSVLKAMDNQQNRLQSIEEGTAGWVYQRIDFKEISEDVLFIIRKKYVTEPSQIAMMQHKASFAAKTIWNKILGRAGIPLFVKPFLAYSYLQQESAYDQRAYDEVEADPEADPTDPVPHLAYGPLVENRGICDGLAWAFKYLMDAAGIPCSCIAGKVDSSPVGHLWNLIQVNGQYYHIDVTTGIGSGSVNIEGMFQSDVFMKKTHHWDASLIPAAKGYHLDYDYIEQFLVDHGAEYLADGASEKYLFPDDIVE